MRVVLDTNIYVSAFVLPGSSADRAMQRIFDGHDTLLISKPIYCGTAEIQWSAHLAWTIHEYLLRRPIVSPGGFSRSVFSTDCKYAYVGLRSRTPRDGIHE